jgi:hypothetical protein
MGLKVLQVHCDLEHPFDRKGIMDSFSYCSWCGEPGIVYSESSEVAQRSLDSRDLLERAELLLEDGMHPICRLDALVGAK